MKKILLPLVASVLITGCAGQSAPVGMMTPSPMATVTQTPVATLTPSPIPQAGVSFTGKMSMNSVNLHLLANSDLASNLSYDQAELGAGDSSGPSRSLYIPIGTISSGTYAGYKRFLAVQSYDGPGQPIFNVLATKNDKEYVVSTDEVDEWNTDSETFDAKKVTKKAALPTNHARTIILNDKFILVRGSPFYYSNETNIDMQADLATYQKVNVPNTVLTFYTPEDSADEQNPYLINSTQMIGVDETGLAYSYYMATPTALKIYNTTKDSATFDGQSPHLGFPKERIITSSTIYSRYDSALFNPCSMALDGAVVKDVKSSDLVRIGTVDGIDIFSLSNVAHPLLDWAYAAKITDNSFMFADGQDPTDTKEKMPSYLEYASKNPLLFIKDHLGRTLMLLENQYEMPYGCGKPVVYLYPTIATDVSIQMQAPMNFSATIPAYHQGWKVNAQPSGKLTDLQPQFTDCAAFDTSAVGHEYANQACADNAYPYIYWAGHVIGGKYPTPTQGWVVAQAELESFMNKTLDTVGLTAQEKADMLEYWLPAMQAHNAPYYRISFLQTAEMNRLAPMKITPAPKSMFRIFLDYQPLESADLQIQPQRLEKAERDGFTVVEWGGLKR